MSESGPDPRDPAGPREPVAAHSAEDGAGAAAGGERRSTRRDRRANAGETRRGAAQPRWKRIAIVVGRDALLIAGTLAAIIAGVRFTNPIFANKPNVAATLVKEVPLAAALVDTGMTGKADTTGRAEIVALPEFEADRKAFAADLVATGHMDPARADTVAYFAVREAYLRGIPPAVVFGVMLTENSRFVSKALSSVGAVGLMQVYPKVWLKALEKQFGRDLETDSTNLKYGVYILSTYIKTDRGRAAPAAVNKGLLRYNGCVRGTNTPHCHNYPSKVATYVQKQGNSICGDKGFYDCIAKPFIAGFTGSRAAE